MMNRAAAPVDTMSDSGAMSPRDLLDDLLGAMAAHVERGGQITFTTPCPVCRWTHDSAPQPNVCPTCTAPGYVIPAPNVIAGPPPSESPTS
jgi:hypothetical protein